MAKFTILTAICTSENFERDEHIIVNHIGEACYLDFNRLSSKELHEIADLKRLVEQDKI
ncbi:hypothetical protein ES708_19670 [subsurface metagenome]